MRHHFVEDKNFEEDMSFGEFIRKKRRLMGYNQSDFANMLGSCKSTISLWELGVTSPPFEEARLIIKDLGGEVLISNRKIETW